MLIKNFQADTVSEALGMVKKKLGPEAVILKTTPLTPKSNHKQPGKRIYQITACIDDGTLTRRAEKKRSTAGDGMTVPDKTIEAMSETLRDLRKDVKSLMYMGKTWSCGSRIGEKMKPHWLHLVNQELDPDLAEDIIAHVEKSNVDTASDKAVRDAIFKEISARLTEPIEIKQFAAKPTTVAIVGPPGAGKSSLVAKLASFFVAKKKVGVTLVTIDDFKPSASFELGRFARILDIPLVNEKLLAQQTKTSTEIVLIDTTGIPVGDVRNRDRMKSRLDNLEIDEVHLVLPAYCCCNDIRKWYGFFSPVGLCATTLTFLDQASAYGAAVSLSILEGARFSYFSRGRTSVRDLETADLRRIARSVVGFDGGES